MTDASPFEPSLVGAIWRDRRLVVLVLLISFGLAIVYAVSRPVQYTAAASVLVEDPRDQGAAALIRSTISMSSAGVSGRKGGE